MMLNQQQYEHDQYQQQQAYAQQQQYAPPPAAPAPADDGDDMIAQLEKLGALHDKGILTDEEFAAQKAKILG